MRLADYRLKIPWVCCCITCHTWPNFTYALLSLHFCISHFRICSPLIHSSLRFSSLRSSLRVEIHHHLKKTMKKSTKKIMEESSIPDGEKELDAALKGSVIPEWRKIRLHFYEVNDDKFVGLVPNRVYFIHTFRKSVDKNKIFFPNSYQLLNLHYYKEIPQFFEELDMECDHSAFLDVTNAVFDDCSFWMEKEYLVGDKFKWLHVESLKDLEEAIKGFQLDVKSMSKFIDKVHRNRALKNLGLESLFSLIDDDSESEGDDVEVGPLNEEGIKKMYEVFKERETLLNRSMTLWLEHWLTLKGLFAAIIGGSKMSSKIELIESLLAAKLDILVLGRGTIFTFYKAQGFSVGSSLVEEDKLDLATSLLKKATDNNVSIFFPIDLVIADKYAADANSKTVKISSIQDGIPDGWMGLDIGPDSVTAFSETLDYAETVIWNGLMGVVEFEKFAVGTKAIVTKLANLSSRRGVRTFIGGGDSIAVVEKAGLADRMIYKSTGGTVGLELLVELAADKTI